MQTILLENEAEKIIRKYLPVAKNKMVQNLQEALKFKTYPCVLKIISKQALHKTEAGGVKIVNSEREMYEKFAELEKIVTSKKLELDGYLVQEFVEGSELFLGIKKDSVFGHVVVFGVGGIFVELLKDVSIRVCPVNDKDAQSMIDCLKMRGIIYGARGKKPINMKKLKSAIVNISKLPSKYKNLKELDINPLIGNDKEVRAVDARMIFEQ